MTPEGKQKLLALVTKHEGDRLAAYTDSTGNDTVGRGHKLIGFINRTRYGHIDEAQSLRFYESDMDYFMDVLPQRLAWLKALDETRQIAIYDMVYNLGINGLLGFGRFLALMESGDYVEAAEDGLDTEWARQVGSRAVDDMNIIRTGELPS